MGGEKIIIESDRENMMIVSDMQYIDRQISMTAHMQRALSFLQRQDIQNLTDGKIEIDGDRVFAIVQ
jgi:beta-galactosidase beta subunit